MTLPTEEHRWELARNKMTQLGSVPASFSSLIRKLRADMQASTPVLSSVAKYELDRLLRSPSLLSPLAYAALEFHPEKLVNIKNLSKAIISAFSLEEICSLVGTLYLTRQVKKRCSEEEWKFIAELLVSNTTLAGHLGGLIAPIGFERALSAVSFTVLGMALFQGSNSKDYATYRRMLKKSNKYFNSTDELKYFGCTSREICSLLAQSVSLSGALASEFLSGPEPEADKRPATGIHALNIWLTSLSKNGTAPQVAMDARWYPTKDKVNQIEAIALQMEQSVSPTTSWILKESGDLAALKPILSQLSKGSAAEAVASEEIDVEVDDNSEPFIE